jgi:hypothetical protein
LEVGLVSTGKRLAGWELDRHVSEEMGLPSGRTDV